MERGDDGKRIAAMEHEMCLLYEKNQDTDECRGASGRKFRRVCIYCPNYERWRERTKRERTRENGNKDKNDH